MKKKKFEFNTIVTQKGATSVWRDWFLLLTFRENVMYSCCYFNTTCHTHALAHTHTGVCLCLIIVFIYCALKKQKIN